MLKSVAKELVVVVPALRVDAVGAKGLGVSRSYFQKGLKAGNVLLDGVPAKAKDEVRPGSVIEARGLGRVVVKEVLGRTARGNYKVRLERSS